MEDGSLNTVEEEKFPLPQGSMMGLVHPIELSQKLLEGWRQQLDDYEITQSILQRPEKGGLENRSAVRAEEWADFPTQRGTGARPRCPFAWGTAEKGHRSPAAQLPIWISSTPLGG